MSSRPTHETVEARFRELIADAGLDPPDAVEYAPDSITLLWHERKIAVVIDLDEDGEPVMADT